MEQIFRYSDVSEFFSMSCVQPQPVSRLVADFVGEILSGWGIVMNFLQPKFQEQDLQIRTYHAVFEYMTPDT